MPFCLSACDTSKSIPSQLNKQDLRNPSYDYFTNGFKRLLNAGYVLFFFGPRIYLEESSFITFL